MPQPVAHLPRLAALAVAMLSAASAQAQPSPFIFRAGERLTYDSNVLRQESNVKHDVISTTSLSAGLDQPYGRQRYLANFTVSGQYFNDLHALNNTGYDVLLGMDWSAASHWSGDARLTTSSQLVPFQNYGTVQADDTTKVTQKATFANFRARYGLASPWAIEGTLAYRRIANSGDLLRQQDINSATVGLGALYQPSDLLNLGAAVRISSGSYPHYYTAEPVKDDFRRGDVDLTAQWRPSGLSTLNARISATSERHPDNSLRNFSGVTGQIGWDYAFTGKTSFGLVLKRDTGDNTSLVSTSTGGSGGSTVTSVYGSPSRVSNSVNATAKWDATGKIRVTAGLGYTRDHYDSLAADLPGGNSDTSTFQLGANYQATRALLFACSLNRSKRSNPNVGGIPGGYRDNTAECLAQLTIQ